MIIITFKITAKSKSDIYQKLPQLSHKTKIKILKIPLIKMKFNN
jgi:hypothetical protein